MSKKKKRGKPVRYPAAMDRLRRAARYWNRLNERGEEDARDEDDEDEDEDGPVG